MATVFPCPSTWMDVSILMTIGARVQTSSSTSSIWPRSSSLVRLAGLAAYGGGAVMGDWLRRLETNSANLRLWWLMESDGGSISSSRLGILRQVKQIRKNNWGILSSGNQQWRTGKENNNRTEAVCFYIYILLVYCVQNCRLLPLLLGRSERNRVSVRAAAKRKGYQ